MFEKYLYLQDSDINELVESFVFFVDIAILIIREHF